MFPAAMLHTFPSDPEELGHAELTRTLDILGVLASVQQKRMDELATLEKHLRGTLRDQQARYAQALDRRRDASQQHQRKKESIGKKLAEMKARCQQSGYNHTGVVASATKLDQTHRQNCVAPLLRLASIVENHEMVGDALRDDVNDNRLLPAERMLETLQTKFNALDDVAFGGGGPCSVGHSSRWIPNIIRPVVIPVTAVIAPVSAQEVTRAAGQPQDQVIPSLAKEDAEMTDV